MFDSYFDSASEYRNSMLGNKLLEGDEEGALKGNGSLNEGQTERRRDEISLFARAKGVNGGTYALDSSRVMANQST